MAAAAAVAVVEVERDPAAIRAAKILVSFRFRELKERPEWATATASREAYEPAAAPVEVPELWGEAAAAEPPEQAGGSCLPWKKALRELGLAGSGGDGAAAGSGSPSTSSADRRARPSPRHAAGEKQPAVVVVAKEPMKASSPVTPLDYGAGGSGASSSADDAARRPAKRRDPGARGSGGGGASSVDDDEGCSSPAKRPRVAAEEEEKPIPTEQSMQSETSASSAKGIAFDLNLPPPDAF